MSFTIKTSDASAFAARGLQDRNARDRRAELRPSHATHQNGTWEDSLSASGQNSAAIRQERDFQALLNESISFLQTQDSALGRIEDLLKQQPESPDAGDFHEVFESLTTEKFNGLDLFSHDAGEQPLPIHTPLGQETISIQRPLMTSHVPLDDLHESVLAAREENHREQSKLHEISITTSKPLAVDGTGGVSNPESVKKTAALSRQYVLRDGATALSSQANSAHSAVLRLFI